jgi:hypothetical protein
MITNDELIELEVDLKMQAMQLSNMDARLVKICEEIESIRSNLSMMMTMLRISTAIITVIAVPILLHYFKLT